MPLEGLFGAEIAEAELVNVHHVDVAEVLRVGRKVPRLDDVLAHLDLLEVPYEMQLGVVLHHTATGAQLLNLLFWLHDRRDLLLCLCRYRRVGHVDVNGTGHACAVFLAERRQRGPCLGGHE